MKIYKALKKKIKQTNLGGLNKNILSNNLNININNESNFFNIPNLLKNNDINNDKITSINKNIEPSDIDDLVKYIVNDDKAETQNKKKKRNKKRKIKMK